MLLTLLSIGGLQEAVTDCKLATLVLKLDSTAGSQNLLAVQVHVAITADRELGSGGSRGESESNSREACLHFDGWGGLVEKWIF